MVPPEGWGVLVGRIADSRTNPLDLVDVQVTNTASGETRLARTYGPGAANPDPYYQENLVLGDLPAGLYKITFEYDDREQQEWLHVYAGQSTYFTFRGKQGFGLGPPQVPTLEALPTLPTPQHSPAAFPPSP
jgi:hypothetical protein